MKKEGLEAQIPKYDLLRIVSNHYLTLIVYIIIIYILKVDIQIESYILRVV